MDVNLKTCKVFKYTALGGNMEYTQEKSIKIQCLVTPKKGQNLILDTHLGSGSNAIAAHYFGKNFVGLELTKTILKRLSLDLIWYETISYEYLTTFIHP